MAGIVYARGIRKQDRVVESMRQKYRRASENWHRLLEFRVPEEESYYRGSKRKYSGWEEEVEDI